MDRFQFTRISPALAIIGVVLVIVGIAIVSQDVGSCPMNAPDCFHTFAGTNSPITPIGDAVGVIGALFVVSSFVVALTHRSQPK